MRSTDEQLRLVRERANMLRRRRSMFRYGVSAACCLLLILVLVVAMPDVSGNVVPPEEAAFGSLLLTSPMLSRIVIGILAFVLGVFVTLLCVHRSARRDGTEDEEP